MSFIEALNYIIDTILGRTIIEEDVQKLPSKKKPKKSIKKKSIKKIILEQFKHPEILEDLDEGQKEAVLSNNKRTLVLAGAGAGKTRVILKRILHLILNKEAKTSSILAMTFTKDATQEMEERLVEYFEPQYSAWKKKIKGEELKQKRRELKNKHPEIRNISISTIHALCLRILKQDGAKVFNTNFTIIGDNKNNTRGVKQEQVIKTVLFQLAEDQEYLELVKQYIIDYLIDLEDIISPIEKSKEGKYITLDLKKVKSKSERDIANFLVQNNIRYQYEKQVNWADKDDPNKKFEPDFYLPDYDLYIEHWWVSKKSDKVDKVFKGHFDKIRYLKEREWKINQFKKYNKKLIHSDESQMQGSLKEYYDQLYKQLYDATGGSIKFTPSKDFVETFKHLKFGLHNLIMGIGKILNLAKSNRITPDQIEDCLKDEKHSEVIQFYEIFIPLYEAFNKYTVENSLLDFNDMIHKVIELFENYPEIAEKYQTMYRHILVDEYQDVSAAQVELIKLMLKEDNNLFAVGDDWQSIYGFRGSEVDFIVDFSEHFPKSQKITLPYNYRSGKTIVEASNEVIMKNPKQVIKAIKAFKEDKSEKIFQYNAKNDLDGAQFIINLVKQLYGKGYGYEDILFLYRRSIHLRQYAEYFKKNNFNINIKTIHGSKGLEAKIVFLVGLKAGSYGFPHVWEDSRITQVIKKTELNKLVEEERRVFYVAMTRAKERLFLIAEKSNTSEYCDDIPDEYKVTKISEAQITREMLSDTVKDTAELLKQGMDEQQIADKRDFTLSTVQQHIAKLIEADIVSVKDFVSEEKYELIKKQIPADKERPRLTPIKQALPDTITWGEIRYVIADVSKSK